MAQAKDKKSTKPAKPAEPPAAGEPDVEGHSIIPAIVTSGAMRARSAEGKKRSKGDEDLPPLTKPFPSMRDERRK